MWVRPITIKEINKFIAPVITALEAKHGGVSSDAFEAELDSITGVKWKQVRNYRNHPSPNQIVGDNAKIKRFILESRRREFSRLLQEKRALWIGGLLAATAVTLVLCVLRPTKHEDHISKGTQSTNRRAFEPKATLIIPAISNLPISLASMELLAARKWDSCIEMSGVKTCAVLIGAGANRTEFKVQAWNGHINSVTVMTNDSTLVGQIKIQFGRLHSAGFKQVAENEWANQGERASIGSFDSPKGNYFLFTLSRTGLP